MPTQKKKPMYCTTCRKTTPHVYTGKTTPFEHTGLMRGMAAVVTFGMSETSWADYHWQCEVCQNIKTK